MYECKVCGFVGEPIREYHATVKLISCPKCGRLIIQMPYPLDWMVPKQQEAAQ